MASYDPVNRILRGRRIPQVYNDYTSVGQVLLNALNDYKQKILQVNDDDGVELSSKQLLDMMVNIAKNLYRFGFRAGDVVGLCASNTTYVAPTIFACYLLRLPISPADKLFDVNGILKIFRKTNPKLIFCDHDAVDKIIQVLEATRSDAIVITMTERIAGFNNIMDLLADCSIEDEGFMYNTPTTIVPAFIACTSGSTGESKLALIPHIQLLQLYMWFEDLVEVKLSFTPASLFWLHAFSHITFRTLNGQRRLITAKPFTADLFFDLIEKHKLNEANLFTPLLKLIVESPRFANADFSCINLITSGGFDTPKRFCQIFHEKLTNGMFVVGYGLSETGGVSFKKISPTSSSSVGIPCVNTEIKIQLDDGTTAFPKEIGEVIVRHPVRFLGYFNNFPSDKYDHDNWYHTGDMGFIDENQELNIVGQRTEAIKNIYCEIYPFKIESRILALNGVQRVVVVGTPDPFELYVPTALIIRNAVSDINEESIRDVVSDLPAYQQLTGGIFFVNELPLAPNGKVKRSEAKEIANELKLERSNMEE